MKHNRFVTWEWRGILNYGSPGPTPIAPAVSDFHSGFGPMVSDLVSGFPPFQPILELVSNTSSIKEEMPPKSTRRPMIYAPRGHEALWVWPGPETPKDPESFTAWIICSDMPVQQAAGQACLTRCRT